MDVLSNLSGPFREPPPAVPVDRRQWTERLEDIEASVARLADFDAEIRRAVAAEDLLELDKAFERWSTERRACVRKFRETFAALNVAVDAATTDPETVVRPVQPDLPLDFFAAIRSPTPAALTNAQAAIGALLVLAGLAVVVFFALSS